MNHDARWRLPATSLSILLGLVTVSLSSCQPNDARLLADSSASPAYVFEPLVLKSAGPTPTATPSAIQTASATPIGTATRTPTPTATTSPIPSVYFPIGPGFSDVIPHQIVRAGDDRAYLFASYPASTTIHVYWTSAPGLPNSQSAFDRSISLTTDAYPLSVEAVSDGGNYVHVLSNLYNGELRDYPFNIVTHTFGASVLLASGNPTITNSGYGYIGSSGVSAMLDFSTTLQIAYWAAGNHIDHRTYAVNTTTGLLTLTSGPTQVDTAGQANHPAVAVSPLDNSLTVAWVSEATTPARILARSRASSGAWGSVETVSAGPVWTSTNFGLNIDQGPSLLIDPSGTKHLAYIEDYDHTGDYGRIHYVVNTGSAWTDTALSAYTHDPALARNSAGELYILGHGHPQSQNTACTDMYDICTIKQTGGVWGNPAIFATPPPGYSFDSSPSVKWSVVGLNRPETIEFLFFMIPVQNPTDTTVYYARLP